MSKTPLSELDNLFARKLDELFSRIRKPNGKAFSYGDVAKGIQQQGSEPAITPGYIWKLRTGAIKNPGYRVIKAIATFFNVPATYFFEEEGAEKELDEINLARQLKDAPQVQQIALRASSLADAEQEAILAMINAIQKTKKGRGKEKEHT